MTQHALRGVKQLPWSARSPDLSPILSTYGTIPREFTLFPEPATNTAELWQRVQDAWENLSQDDIRHLYNRLHGRIHSCVADRGVSTVYSCDCLGTPFSDICFIWSEFISIYSYNDKLPITSISITMNFSFKVFHFSGSVFNCIIIWKTWDILYLLENIFYFNIVIFWQILQAYSLGKQCLLYFIFLEVLSNCVLSSRKYIRVRKQLKRTGALACQECWEYPSRTSLI